MTETETASFWYAGRPVRAGRDPAARYSHRGLSDAGRGVSGEGRLGLQHPRLLQWHDKVVSQPGDSRSETWFIFHPGPPLKQLYAGSTDLKDSGLAALAWDYPPEGEEEEPSADAALKEMNGYTWWTAVRSKLSAPDRRWDDRLRRLVLLRRLSRGGRKSCPVTPDVRVRGSGYTTSDRWPAAAHCILSVDRNSRDLQSHARAESPRRARGPECHCRSGDRRRTRSRQSGLARDGPRGPAMNEVGSLPVRAEDRVISTYYGQPAVKPSLWGWLVSSYIFIAGSAERHKSSPRPPISSGTGHWRPSSGMGATSPWVRRYWEGRC
jgi:hypothetical protein